MTISEKNTRTQITINRDFYKKCQEVAEKEGRSFSSLCIYALKKYLEEYQNNHKGL